MRIQLDSHLASESLGDVTCDSLGDVTRSHGTHDVRDLSGRSDRSTMGILHQEGPSHVCEGFFTTVILVNRGTILDCSLVNSTPISRHGVYDGGDSLGLARRGVPVSTSTAVLWADLFCKAGCVTLLQTPPPLSST